MSDTFTEVTSESWFSRIGGAIKGIFGGFLLLLIGVVLLFWNEGRAVKTHHALVQGQGQVQSIDASEYRSSFNGKLVHLSGMTTTGDYVVDSDFGIKVNALKLKRSVETYQWQETKSSEQRKKLGGGTETVTTFEYQTGWHNQLISSANFRQSAGHQNPKQVPYQSQEWVANNITIGEYQLSSTLVEDIDNYQRYSIGQASTVRTNISHYGNTFYYGSDPQQPQVGDQRIHFQVIYPQDYSVAARANQRILAPHLTISGHSIALLSPGILSADSMFEQAKAENAMLTWTLRAVGTLVLFLGFIMIFKPLSVVADVLPLAGNIIEMGSTLVALLLSLIIALLTISIAWIAYRPLVGIALLLVGGVITWLVLNRGKQAQIHIAAQLTPQQQMSV